MNTPSARNDIPIYRYFLIATSCGRSITFRFGRMTIMYSVWVRNWVGNEISGHWSLSNKESQILVRYILGYFFGIDIFEIVTKIFPP